MCEHPSPRILIVEDDRRLNLINCRALESRGYVLASAYTLSEAREILAQADPDVILLDVKLPDGSGIDFCREIRGATDAHIIFLTSATESASEMEGLLAGGDDYLRKPYGIELLRERVNAALRRREAAPAQPDDIIERGALRLSTVLGQALLRGKDLLLTPKEFALLLFFVRNAGKSFSEPELYIAVWGQQPPVDTGTVQVHISNLRKKIRASGHPDVDIEKVGRQYYRFDI